MSTKSFHVQTALLMNQNMLRYFLKSKFGCCSSFATVSGQCSRALYYLAPGVLAVGDTSGARVGGKLPRLC